MAKRVGVLLSGCGRLDGSDVAETMLALLVIERAGARGDLRRARRRSGRRRRSPERRPGWAARATRASRRRASAGAGPAARPSWTSNAIDALIVPGGEGTDRDAVRLPREARALRRSTPTSRACCAALLQGAPADGLHRPVGAARGARAGTGGGRARDRRSEGGRRPPSTPPSWAPTSGPARRGRDRRPEGPRLLDARVPRGGRAAAGVARAIDRLVRARGGATPRIGRLPASAPDGAAASTTTGPSRGSA